MTGSAMTKSEMTQTRSLHAAAVESFARFIRALKDIRKPVSASQIPVSLEYELVVVYGAGGLEFPSAVALLNRPLGDMTEMAETLAVQTVTDNDFEQTINAGKPVFVDFWAPWCGPCRLVGPIVEELAPNYQGRAIIAKMNVDDNPNVAQKFGVTSIPTMMMFKNGKLVDRVVGAMPKGQLEAFINRNL